MRDSWLETGCDWPRSRRPHVEHQRDHRERLIVPSTVEGGTSDRKRRVEFQLGLRTSRLSRRYCVSSNARAWQLNAGQCVRPRPPARSSAVPQLEAPATAGQTPQAQLAPPGGPDEHTKRASCASCWFTLLPAVAWRIDHPVEPVHVPGAELPPSPFNVPCRGCSPKPISYDRPAFRLLRLARPCPSAPSTNPVRYGLRTRLARIV